MTSSSTTSAAPVSPAHSEWIRNVRIIATRVLEPDKRNTLTHLLQEAINTRLSETGQQALSLNDATVDAWLTGAALPENETVHTALMEVLKLENNPGTTAQQKVRHGIRVKLEATYKTAPAELKQVVKTASVIDDPPTPLHKSRRDPVGMRTPRTTHEPEPTQHVSSMVFHDHPAIPARMHEGNVDYRGLSVEELDHLMYGNPARPETGDGTRNFHEFLTCARVLKYGSQHKLAQAVGVRDGTIAMFEHGGKGTESQLGIPSLETFRALQHALFHDDPQGASKFEDLYISNRLSIGHHEEGLGHYGVMAQHLKALPRVYWQEVLAKHADAAAWKSQRDKPEWSHHVIEVHSCNEYLQAFRRWHECSKDSFAEISGLSLARLNSIEDGAARINTEGETFKSYCTGLEELERQALAKAMHPPHFSREKAAQLPTLHIGDRQWTNRTASDNGQGGHGGGIA